MLKFFKSKKRKKNKNHIASSEYDPMKYKLTSETLGIALWNMEPVSSDPVNLNNKIILSQELRNMLGFDNEREFPNVLKSWSDRLHPGDKEMAIAAFAAHINDYTGNTPFDIKYRLMHKNGDYRYIHAFGTTLRDGKGVPIRVAGALRDITELKNRQMGFIEISQDIIDIMESQESLRQMAEELEYALQSAKEANEIKDDILIRMEKRDKMLQAVNQASELLLTVDESGGFEPALIESMEIIGRSVDADRVHIWRNDATNGGELAFFHAYMWLSEIGKKKIPVPMGIITPFAKMSEWEAKFKRNEYIGGPLSSLSQAEQEYFNAFDIKSVFLFPLFLDEQFWGLISIDDCEQERDFSEEEISILQSVSLMMASSINRYSLINKINEANERLMLMLDTSPLCTQIWDRNLNTIDCNEAGVRLYGFKDKQEYVDRFLTSCSPEYQPDGQRSDEKAVMLVNRAFEDGICIFDWMHKMPDDDILIPAEITLVRAKYRNDDVVLGYTRDMREHDAMMKGIDHRDNMMQAVNKSSSFLLNADIANFENALRQSMSIIAESVDVDCVYLWRNHTENGELYCSQVFEWSPNKIVFANEGLCKYDEVVPGWKETLSSGKYINNLVRNLSKKEQEHLSPSGILSILVMPVFINEQFWGVVGFDDTNKERIFTSEEESVLYSASYIIANSFIRNEMLQQIIKRDAELEMLVEDRTHELALQTATLNALFDSIPSLIFTKNPDFKFMHCNKAFLENFGKRAEDFIGLKDTVSFDMPDEMAERYHEDDYTVMREAQTIKTEEYIPRFDGEAFLYELHKIPLIIDGAAVGIIGLAHDISERKEAELKLAAHYEYSNKLSDALATITKSANISAGDIKAAANNIAKEGCDVLNVHRVSIWKISENGDALKNISNYEKSTGKYEPTDDFDFLNRKEYANLLKTERLIIASDIHESAILDDGYNPNLCAMLEAPIRIDGKLAGLVCADLDRCEEFPEKRKWLIEEQNFVSSLADLMALALVGYERSKAREAAENANQAKSAFLANMSHEIRTPMNAILGITDILMQSEILPEDIEDGLDRIYSSCDMLLGIINDILDFSKIEAGKLDITPAQYKVASLINDSIQVNMMRGNGKPIEFEIQIDENIPAKLIGDELRIKQILNNLLSNAFKYTDSGKVTLSIVSEAWPGEDGVTLVVIVRDTGRGISKEQLKSLFDEYSRFNQGSGSTEEGTGLGLAITRRLINLMDGGIDVESEPEVGSLFVVRLPQRTVDRSVLGSEVARNLQNFRMNYVSRKRRGQIMREPMPYGSVLIVDDVETNLYVAAGLMKPYDLQIDTVVSGREAIELIKSGKEYDVIFMDHMMPEMDGVETTKHLRALVYTNPIVALTANAVVGQADMFLQNGFDDFISKPIDMRQLNSILNRLVRDKQPIEVIEAAGKSSGSENKEQRQKANMSGELPAYSHVDSRLKNKAIDGLNIKKGLERYDDDEEIYLKILRSYVFGVRSMLEAIDSFREDKLLDYQIKVHGIKGASFDIFAEPIGKKASELEDAANGGDIVFIEKHNPLFLESAWKFINDIDNTLSVIDAENPKPKKDTPDSALLLKIIESCAEYDMDSMDMVMEEIEKYQYEQDDGLAVWLRENVNMMNFSEIIERLCGLQENK